MKIKCKVCDGILKKENKMFVCEKCGVKYKTEYLKSLVNELEDTSDKQNIEQYSDQKINKFKNTFGTICSKIKNFFYYNRKKDSFFNSFFNFFQKICLVLGFLSILVLSISLILVSASLCQPFISSKESIGSIISYYNTPPFTLVVSILLIIISLINFLFLLVPKIRKSLKFSKIVYILDLSVMFILSFYFLPTINITKFRNDETEHSVFDFVINYVLTLTPIVIITILIIYYFKRKNVILVNENKKTIYDYLIVVLLMIFSLYQIKSIIDFCETIEIYEIYLQVNASNSFILTSISHYCFLILLYSLYLLISVIVSVLLFVEKIKQLSVYHYIIYLSPTFFIEIYNGGVYKFYDKRIGEYVDFKYFSDSFTGLDYDSFTGLDNYIISINTTIMFWVSLLFVIIIGCLVYLRNKELKSSKYFLEKEQL